MDQAQIVKEIEKARVREAIVRQLDGVDYHDYRMMRDQADEVTIDFGGVHGCRNNEWSPASRARQSDPGQYAQGGQTRMADRERCFGPPGAARTCGFRPTPR